LSSCKDLILSFISLLVTQELLPACLPPALGLTEV
jgi:hypothetical protein